MSASPTSGLPASIAAEIQLAGPQAAGDHVAIGNGVGVKQVVVETWNNKPYVFMINTNNELYYGNSYTTAATSFPWNSYDSFSGWTFITGAAKEIAVDIWQNNPYIYLINSKDDLYYGHLSTVSSGTAIPSGQSAFSGWSFLTGAAKDVAVGPWQGASYIYLINSNNELYFGDLYATTSTAIPPAPSQTLFSGWTFITGAAKTVSVDLWRNAPYLYLINSKDELYYGNLYFDPKAAPSPIPQALFSGWQFVTGAAKSVVVSQWRGDPYLYLINSKDELYYGNLSASSAPSNIPPGLSTFGGWHFITGAAKQVAVGQWQNNPYLYLINSKDELYYGSLSTTSAGASFSGWTFVTGAAKQVAAGTWQTNPYMYLINSNDDLFQSHLYANAATTFPWNVYTAFSGWTAL